MYVYIIRHGETAANAKGVFQGQEDGKLLEIGRELAEITGRALRGTCFDAAFTSPLSRAVETAEAVLAASNNSDVKLIYDNRILEINMGDYEGKRFRPEVREVDAELCRLFFEDPFSFSGFPNGESTLDVCSRTQSFLSDLKNNNFRNVLISTHGFALRAMLNRLYKNPFDFWQGHVPYNCSVSVVEVGEHTTRLVEGDAIYYEKELCVDRYADY